MTSSKRRNPKTGSRKASSKPAKASPAQGAGGNGDAPKQANGKHEIGATVAISSDDAETLKLYEQRVNELHRQIGAKRAELHEFEAKAMETLRKTQSEYNAMVLAVAQKKGLNVAEGSNESWRYDQDTQKFTRTG